jgi:hypothetical protein
MNANDWTVRRVDLGYGGEEGSWLCQYQPALRWNGWIAFPYFDAYTVVDILDNYVNRPGSDPYHWYDYHFEDDGTLVTEDRQERTEYPEDFEPERIEPDEDGLYSLGAYGWTWDEISDEEGSA